MILLDTNVVSELMKPRPNPAVERWFLLHDDQCCLSATVLGELFFGVAKLDDGAKRARLEAQLAEWRIRFADRILPFAASTAPVYGTILADARRHGRPMSVPDAQIAAAASEAGCRLATRNVRDFATVDLDVVDPWDS